MYVCAMIVLLFNFIKFIFVYLSESFLVFLSCCTCEFAFFSLSKI